MRTRTPRLMLAAATIGAAALAVPASAAEGGECQLNGKATFTNGPATDSARSFTYTFAGKLTSCRSNVADAPDSGVIATLTPATGKGSCASNSTDGLALVTWKDKTTSVVKYSTVSATGAVRLSGSVVPSAKVGSKVVKSTRYSGYGAAGLLAFEASPAECAGAGVKAATIEGLVGVGK